MKVDIKVEQLNKAATDRLKKAPTPFPKKEEIKKKIPKDIEGDAMDALKALLSQNKTGEGPTTFSPFFAQVSKVEASKIQGSNEIMKLFDKMIKALVATHEKGISETTFLLGDHFNLFEGSKITITEYSTAPKVFNINFSAPETALAVFQTHAADLLTALKTTKFDFEVNRLDSQILTEKTHRRVERDLEEKEDNQK